MVLCLAQAISLSNATSLEKHTDLTKTFIDKMINIISACKKQLLESSAIQ